MLWPCLFAVISPKLSFWLAGCLTLAGIGLTAETGPQPAPGSPEVGHGEDLPATRGLSPHLQAVLRSGLPAYKPVQPVSGENADRTVRTKADSADGEVLVLPNLVVNGPRPPKPADLLTAEGKLHNYLGPKDGFDRGVLNRVVLQWGNFSLFNAVTNETRAEIALRDELRLRNRAALLDFAAALKEAGDAALSEQLKRESDGLFLRK